jgi:hypothetical protein
MEQKMTKLFISLFIAAAMVTPAMASLSWDDGTCMVVTVPHEGSNVGVLNIRKGPGTGYPIAHRLRTGEIVPLYRRQNLKSEWIRVIVLVDYETNNWHPGWARSKFLQPTNEECGGL